MLSPRGFDFSEEFLGKIPTLELKIDQISPPRANYTLVKHIWSDVYKPSTKTTAYLQKLSPRNLFFKIQDGRNVISFPDPFWPRGLQWGYPKVTRGQARCLRGKINCAILQ